MSMVTLISQARESAKAHLEDNTVKIESFGETLCNGDKVVCTPVCSTKPGENTVGHVKFSWTLNGKPISVPDIGNLYRELAKGSPDKKGLQAKRIKKSEIDAALKAKFNMDKVRIDNDLSPTGKGTPFLMRGEEIQGIYAAAHTPTDYSARGAKKAEKVFRSVYDFILDLEGVALKDGEVRHKLVTFTCNGGTEDAFELVLFLGGYPTYSEERGMDRDFATSWVTIRYRDPS